MEKLKTNYDYKFRLSTWDAMCGIVLEESKNLIKIRRSDWIRNGKVYYLNKNKLMWYREI